MISASKVQTLAFSMSIVWVPVSVEVTSAYKGSCCSFLFFSLKGLPTTSSAAFFLLQSAIEYEDRCQFPHQVWKWAESYPYQLITIPFLDQFGIIDSFIYWRLLTRVWTPYLWCREPATIFLCVKKKKEKAFAQQNIELRVSTPTLRCKEPESFGSLIKSA